MRAIYPLCSATVEINSQVSGSSLCWYTALPNSDRCEIHTVKRYRCGKWVWYAGRTFACTRPDKHPDACTIPFEFNLSVVLLKRMFELFELQ